MAIDRLLIEAGIEERFVTRKINGLEEYVNPKALPEHCKRFVRLNIVFPARLKEPGRTYYWQVSALTPPARLATFRTMKVILHAGSGGRVPVLPEKRFLISCWRQENEEDNTKQ